MTDFFAAFKKLFDFRSDPLTLFSCLRLRTLYYEPLLTIALHNLCRSILCCCNCKRQCGRRESFQFHARPLAVQIVNYPSCHGCPGYNQGILNCEGLIPVSSSLSYSHDNKGERRAYHPNRMSGLLSVVSICQLQFTAIIQQHP